VRSQSVVHHAHGSRGSVVRDAVLDRADVVALLRVCSTRSSTGLRNRALITLLYRGGMRLSVALGLCGDDLDWRERRIRIREGGSERSVALDTGSFRELERWQERRAEHGLADAPFICTLQGAPVQRSYVRALLPRLAREAGVERRVSAEALRRTLAAELAREGYPLPVIQAHLGHRSPATTSRFLARLSDDEAEADVDGALRRRPDWRR